MSGESGRLLFASWVLALATGVSGCTGSDDEDVVHAGEQTKAFCEADCTRGEACGGDPASACRSYCEAQVSLEGFRPDAVQIVAECILKLPCDQFFAADAFVPCWDRAKQKLDPTERTRRFCFSWSTRWFECGSTYSTEECESDWELTSNAYLDRMSECMKLDCDAFGPCVQSVQGTP